MDKLEKLREQLGQLADDFFDSPIVEHLSPAKKENTSFIADTFVNYAINYVGDTPEQWDSSTINEVCLHYVPGKVSSEPATFECYAEILILFFSFLKEKGVLENIDHLQKATKEIAEEIPKRAADPRNWHMAKSILMPSVQSGLDLSDEDNLNEYMQIKQQESLFGLMNEGNYLSSHDPIRKGKKIGRNEKIDVKYEDGTIKKGVKFKKVMKDIELGKCEIIQ